jgi:hypothetical protein
MNRKEESSMNVIANYKRCKQHMNKFVRIHTSHGIYTGKIVKLDKQKVYLRVSSKRNGKKATTSFLPFILPLVLFDLLAIVLVSTPCKRFI